MNKENLKQRQNNILELVREFCSKKLDEEYFELSERLVQKLGRKRNSPMETGQEKIWASAIIHALGTINFLFDNTFEPHIKTEEISSYFGTNKSTTRAKSKLIRDLLKLEFWDKEFSTQYAKENNPFAKLVLVDGNIVQIDKLPEELQRLVKQTRSEGKDISFTTR
jgi:hypothetical protein